MQTCGRPRVSFLAATLAGLAAWISAPNALSQTAQPIAGGCAGGALGPAHDMPGVLCEDFDTDRNHSGAFEWIRLFTATSTLDPLLAFPGCGDDVLGNTAGGGAVPLGVDGRICSNNVAYPLAQQTCHVVPSENDWHLHTPFEGCDDVYDSRPAFDARCGPEARAHSGFRSLHLGRHVDPTDTLYDTYRFRQTSAFVMDPLNVGAGSLLEFWHIIQVCDGTCISLGSQTQTTAGGQVQISLLDGGTGTFERWRRLTPTENGYNAVSQSIIIVCEFDPGDDQHPPDDETMCSDEPQWSNLGDLYGSDRTCMTDQDGNDPYDRDCGMTTNRTVQQCSWVTDPNCGSFLENGSQGRGVWARSQFDLSSFSGRTARLRWILEGGGGWGFGTSRSFIERVTGTNYFAMDHDDGWYVDDIRITEVMEPLGLCLDADGDGYGSPGDPSCPGGQESDCGCLDASVHPGASEQCDTLDNDCNGVIDDIDADADGHFACSSDCDDADPARYAGHPELCDGIDNDCDLIVPAAEADGDGDGAVACAECDDGNAHAIALPAMIDGLDITDGANGWQLSWTDQSLTAGDGTVYDVFVGQISTLQSAGSFSPGSCQKENQKGAQYLYRGADPPPGDAIYFMLRGQNGCPAGTGSYGDANRDTTADASAQPCR
jgi:hypothetical protein